MDKEIADKKDPGHYKTQSDQTLEPGNRVTENKKSTLEVVGEAKTEENEHSVQNSHLYVESGTKIGHRTSIEVDEFDVPVQNTDKRSKSVESLRKINVKSPEENDPKLDSSIENIK